MDEKDNLVDLKEKRKEKKERDEKPKAPKPSDLYFTMAKAINVDQLSMLPPFPGRYFSVSLDGDEKKILKAFGDRQIRFCSQDALVADIVKYTQDSIFSEAFKWTVKQAREAADYWLYYSQPIKMPKSFGFKETEGYVFQRLPWTKDLEDLSTPLFDELFARIDNGEALIKWIGSLFFGNSDRQVYVWLYGVGGDGKGAISRFLRKVFGGSYSSETVPDSRNQFWSSGLIGKRLVAFNDCNHYGFPSTGLFKSLTGGDYIRVEEKFGKSYTVEIDSKFMFLSNDRPALSSGAADLRRVILCQFERIAGSASPTYEARLWEEGNAFILKCVASYLETNGDHSPISSDREALADWVAVVEERYEELLRGWFHVKEGVRCTPSEMQEFMRENLKKRADQFEFTKYLERMYGIKKKSVRDDTGPRYYYVGIKLRANFERNRL